MTLLNKSLIYMLILTLVASFLAYMIVVKAYDSFPEEGFYGE
ncbi:MAG: hypothetical protein WC839_02430 [Candidatus Paceibacterota bacterium]